MVYAESNIILINKVTPLKKGKVKNHGTCSDVHVDPFCSTALSTHFGYTYDTICI